MLALEPAQSTPMTLPQVSNMGPPLLPPREELLVRISSSQTRVMTPVAAVKAPANGYPTR